MDYNETDLVGSEDTQNPVQDNTPSTTKKNIFRDVDPNELNDLDFDSFVKTYAKKRGVPSKVVKSLLNHESGGDPTKVSAAGAEGVGQFMPRTAKQYGIDPTNKWESAVGTVNYLEDSYKALRPHTKNDAHAWNSSIASYLTGPETVKKSLLKGEEVPTGKDRYTGQTIAQYVEAIARRAGYTDENPHGHLDEDSSEGDTKETPPESITQPAAPNTQETAISAPVEGLDSSASGTPTDIKSETGLKGKELSRDELKKKYGWEEGSPELKQYDAAMQAPQGVSPEFAGLKQGEDTGNLISEAQWKRQQDFETAQKIKTNLASVDDAERQAFEAYRQTGDVKDYHAALSGTLVGRFQVQVQPGEGENESTFVIDGEPVKDRAKASEMIVRQLAGQFTRNQAAIDAVVENYKLRGGGQVRLFDADSGKQIDDSKEMKEYTIKLPADIAVSLRRAEAAHSQNLIKKSQSELDNNLTAITVGAFTKNLSFNGLLNQAAGTILGDDIKTLGLNRDTGQFYSYDASDFGFEPGTKEYEKAQNKIFGYQLIGGTAGELVKLASMSGLIGKASNIVSRTTQGALEKLLPAAVRLSQAGEVTAASGSILGTEGFTSAAQLSEYGAQAAKAVSQFVGGTTAFAGLQTIAPEGWVVHTDALGKFTGLDRAATAIENGQAKLKKETIGDLASTFGQHWAALALFGATDIAASKGVSFLVKNPSTQAYMGAVLRATGKDAEAAELFAHNTLTPAAVRALGIAASSFMYTATTNKDAVLNVLQGKDKGLSTFVTDLITNAAIMGVMHSTKAEDTIFIKNPENSKVFALEYSKDGVSLREAGKAEYGVNVVEPENKLDLDLLVKTVVDSRGTFEQRKAAQEAFERTYANPTKAADNRGDAGAPANAPDVAAGRASTEAGQEEAASSTTEPSQYNKLVQVAQPEIEALRGKGMESPEAQGIIDGIYTKAEKEGIEPRHVDALVSNLIQFQLDAERPENKEEAPYSPPPQESPDTVRRPFGETMVTIPAEMADRYDALLSERDSAIREAFKDETLNPAQRSIAKRTAQLEFIQKAKQLIKEQDNALQPTTTATSTGAGTRSTEPNATSSGAGEESAGARSENVPSGTERAGGKRGERERVSGEPNAGVSPEDAGTAPTGDATAVKKRFEVNNSVFETTGRTETRNGEEFVEVRNAKGGLYYLPKSRVEKMPPLQRVESIFNPSEGAVSKRVQALDFIKQKVRDFTTDVAYYKANPGRLIPSENMSVTGAPPLAFREGSGFVQRNDSLYTDFDTTRDIAQAGLRTGLLDETRSLRQLYDDAGAMTLTAKQAAILSEHIENPSLRAALSTVEPGRTIAIVNTASASRSINDFHESFHAFVTPFSISDEGLTKFSESTAFKAIQKELKSGGGTYSSQADNPYVVGQEAMAYAVTGESRGLKGVSKETLSNAAKEFFRTLQAEHPELDATQLKTYALGIGREIVRDLAAADRTAASTTGRKADQEYLLKRAENLRDIPQEVFRDAQLMGRDEFLEKYRGAYSYAARKAVTDIFAGADTVEKELLPINFKLLQEARDYASTVGKDYRATEYLKPKEEVLKKIADMQEQLPHDPGNPEVKKSYDALKSETVRQYKFLQKKGVKFEPWQREGQPYTNSAEMREDVLRNKHLFFFTGGDMPADHPLAERTGISINGVPLTYNDVFRAVHDYFGHAVSGAQFGYRGEFNATDSHSKMYSDTAVPAMVGETIFQNSFVNFGSHLRDSEGNIAKKGEPGYVRPEDRSYAEQKALNISPELMNLWKSSYSTDKPKLDQFGTDPRTADNIKPWNLDRYSKKGLPTVDPAFYGQGQTGKEGLRPDRVPVSYYYISGTKPETQFQSPAYQRLKVEGENLNIYDLSQDSLDLRTKLNNNATQIERYLKENGFDGYYSPERDADITYRNIVAVFKPLTAQKAEAAPLFRRDESDIDPDFIKAGNYSTLSAEKSDLTPEENAARTKRLTEDLVRKGFTPIAIKGAYDGKPENSLFVPVGSEGDRVIIESLGELYGQESVLHARSGQFTLRFTDGENKGMEAYSPSNEVVFNSDATSEMAHSTINGIPYSVKGFWNADTDSWNLRNGESLIKKSGELNARQRVSEAIDNSARYSDREGTLWKMLDRARKGGIDIEKSGRGRADLPQVLQGIEKAYREIHPFINGSEPSPAEAMQRYVSEGIATTREILKSDAYDMKWYSEDMDKTFEIMSREFPGIDSSKAMQQSAGLLLAISSQRADVQTNFSDGRELLKNLLETLSLPDKKANGANWGVYGTAVESVDRIYKGYTYQKTAEGGIVMKYDPAFHRDYQERGMSAIFDELAKPGMAAEFKAQDIFGMKIGSFLLNLAGNAYIPTIDSWMIRDWKIINGGSAVMGKDKNTGEEKLVVNDNSTPKNTDRMRAGIQAITNQLRSEGFDINPTEVQALKWLHLKAITEAMGQEDRIKSYSDAASKYYEKNPPQAANVAPFELRTGDKPGTVDPELGKDIYVQKMSPEERALFRYEEQEKDDLRDKLFYSALSREISSDKLPDNFSKDVLQKFIENNTNIKKDERVFSGWDTLMENWGTYVDKGFGGTSREQVLDYLNSHRVKIYETRSFSGDEGKKTDRVDRNSIQQSRDKAVEKMTYEHGALLGDIDALRYMLKDKKSSGDKENKSVEVDGYLEYLAKLVESIHAPNMAKYGYHRLFDAPADDPEIVKGYRGISDWLADTKAEEVLGRNMAGLSARISSLEYHINNWVKYERLLNALPTSQTEGDFEPTYGRYVDTFPNPEVEKLKNKKRELQNQHLAQMSKLKDIVDNSTPEEVGGAHILEDLSWIADGYSIAADVLKRYTSTPVTIKPTDFVLNNIKRLAEIESEIDTTRREFLKVQQTPLSNYREHLIKVGEDRGGITTFSKHYNEQEGIIATARTVDREEGDKKILSIQEIQSDHHQRAVQRIGDGVFAEKRYGYKDESGLPSQYLQDTLRNFIHEHSLDEGELDYVRKALTKISKIAFSNKSTGKTPEEVINANAPEGLEGEDFVNLAKVYLENELNYLRPEAAPFAKNWHEVVFRRMLKYAAENGYDEVEWTGGKTQNERYDLRKEFSEIRYNEAQQRLEYMRKGSREISEVSERVSPNNLKDYIGPELAKRLMTQESQVPTNLSKMETYKGEYEYALMKSLLQSKFSVSEREAENRLEEYFNHVTEVGRLNSTSEELIKPEELEKFKRDLENDDVDSYSEIASLRVMVSNLKAVISNINMLEKIAPTSTRVLKGDDLVGGGEGMFEFYDNKLPSYARSLAKKLGTEVYQKSVTKKDEGGYAVETPYWGMPVKASFNERMPLFRKPQTEDEWVAQAEQYKGKKLSKDEEDFVRTTAALGSEKEIQNAIEQFHTSMPRFLIKMYKANLLSGIGTSAANLSTNALMLGMEEAARLPASFMDFIGSAVTGKDRTVQGPSIRGLIEMAKGFKPGMEEFVNEVKGKEKDTPYAYYHKSGINWLDNTIGKVGDTIIRFVAGQDKIFRSAAIKRAAYEAAWLEAKNGGRSIEDALANPTIEQSDRALRFGLYATFNNDNFLNDKYQELKRGVSEFSEPLGWLLDTKIPFVRTGSNIFNVSLDYLGVNGTLRGLNALKQSVDLKSWEQTKKNITEGWDKPEVRREAAQLFGRGLIGMGIVYLGYAAAQAGMIRINPFYQEGDWEQYNEQANNNSSPLQVKINGKWYGFGRLGAAGLLLAAGGYALKYNQGAKGTSVKDFATQVAQSAPLGKAAEDLNKPDRDNTPWYMYFLPDPTSAVPLSGLMRDVSGMGDTKRVTRVKGDYWKTQENRIKEIIPGRRQELPERVSSLGYTQDQPAVLKGFSTTARETPLIKELETLGWFPSSYNGKVEFTREEKIKRRELLERAIDSSEYQSLVSKEDKKDFLEAAVKKAVEKPVKDVTEEGRKEKERKAAIRATASRLGAGNR